MRLFDFSYYNMTFFNWFIWCKKPKSTCFSCLLLFLPCKFTVGLREVLVFKTFQESETNTVSPAFYSRLLLLDAVLRFSWLLTACSLCVRFQPAQRYGLSYMLVGWMGLPLGHEVVLLVLAVAEVARRALWTCARVERALLFQLALISSAYSQQLRARDIALTQKSVVNDSVSPILL
jgi:hypothetical protein